MPRWPQDIADAVFFDIRYGLRWIDLDLQKGEVHVRERADCYNVIARLVGEWIASVGLDPLKFGTHSLRRTKATLIYRRTGNLRAVQLLLGHTKIESTVRYLGIEIDDAIEIAEKIEV